MCRGLLTTVNFDVQASLDIFLADASKSSLELPPLTSEQRRQVKKAAAQHMGLRCESFGFGEERRVHLFKIGDASSGVMVRNTFIDGFANTGKSGEALFSTVPAELPTLLRRRKASAPEMLEESDLCPQVFLQTGEWLFPADEPTKRLSVRELVGMPPGLRSPDASKLPVRNTFIEVKVSSELDKRIVQSLPHGMFRQQLLAEALSDSWPAASKTGPQGSEGAGVLSAGSHVMIVGLVKLPAFNGRRARVQSFDAATGRYTVLLAAGMGAREAKVKRENLVIAPLTGSDAAPR
jgi:hypothetical protein